MNITYQKWFSIQLPHGYFKNGLCTTIAIQPFAETTALFKNHKLIFRREDGVFTMYVGLEHQNNNPLNDISSIGTLYFQVLSEDPLFQNYTELPEKAITEVTLLRNSAESSLLHKNSEISFADSVTIHQEYLKIETLQENDVIEIRKETTSEIIQKIVVDSAQLEINNKYLILNMRQFPTSQYRVWRNGEAVGETFYHFNTDIASNCMGVLEIDPEKIFVQNNQELTFSMVFSVRKVYKKYKIVTSEIDRAITIIGIRKSVNSTMPEITDAIAYTELEEEQLPNGQIAKVFISSKPEALVQHLNRYPELSYTYPDAQTTTISTLNLPNPSPKSLEVYTTSADVKTYCATVIVYM